MYHLNTINRLITAYPNDLKSLKYERRFLKLSPEQLVDQAKFTSDIESMYSSLDKAMWPVLVVSTLLHLFFSTPTSFNSEKSAVFLICFQIKFI